MELNLRPLGGDGELKGKPDNGESFWPGSESLRSPRSLGSHFSHNPSDEPKVETKQNEILIVTPEGITRHHYRAQNSLK